MKSCLIALVLLAIAAPYARAQEVVERESFTLIVLPDTQMYTDTPYAQKWERENGKPLPESGDFREHLFGQTRWIKENKDELNIMMVLHEGDIVQVPYQKKQWAIVDTAFKII